MAAGSRGGGSFVAAHNWASASSRSSCDRCTTAICLPEAVVFKLSARHLRLQDLHGFLLSRHRRAAAISCPVEKAVPMSSSNCRRDRFMTGIELARPPTSPTSIGCKPAAWLSPPVMRTPTSELRGSACASKIGNRAIVADVDDVAHRRAVADLFQHRGHRDLHQIDMRRPG